MKARLITELEKKPWTPCHDIEIVDWWGTTWRIMQGRAGIEVTMVSAQRGKLYVSSSTADVVELEPR